jgi:hypothetical protein
MVLLLTLLLTLLLEMLLKLLLLLPLPLLPCQSSLSLYLPTVPVG